MQHAAIDSNSTAPIFTGISFSSVSSSSNPFGQFKANLLLKSALPLGLSAHENYLRFSSVCQSLKLWVMRFAWLREHRFMDGLMNLMINKNSLNMRRRYQVGGVYLGPRRAWGTALVHA